VPYAIATTKRKEKIIFEFLNFIKTSKFNNFQTIGPNTTKQSPFNPLCKELSISTKNTTGDTWSMEILP